MDKMIAVQSLKATLPEYRAHNKFVITVANSVCENILFRPFHSFENLIFPTKIYQKKQSCPFYIEIFMGIYKNLNILIFLSSMLLLVLNFLLSPLMLVGRITQ